MAITRTFTKAELIDDFGVFEEGEVEEGKPGCVVVQDKITGKSRWSDIHTLIFHLKDQPEGDAWSVTYRRGATESQEERPWENEETVTATLVRATPKTVIVYVPVTE